MRTILIGNKCAESSRYDLENSGGRLEMQFEVAVARALTCLYPHCYCIRFEGVFRHDLSSCRPDYALIAKDFSHWFVIEVELSTHSLERHVLPQMRCIRYGSPQSDCASILSQKLGIEYSRAVTLIEYIPRATAVVVDAYSADWDRALRALDVQMLAVSTFHSNSGEEALEVRGKLEVLRESLGFGMYSIRDRAILLAPTFPLPEGRFQIVDSKFGVAWWTVTRSNDAVWLLNDGVLLDVLDGSYVQLVRTCDGRISLRRSSPGRAIGHERSLSFDGLDS